MREALRCWNMTVQHWLVFIVYKRWPVRSLRTAMVMLVSSVWHGVHPGYYLSLGSVPLCLMVTSLLTSPTSHCLTSRWRTTTGRQSGLDCQSQLRRVTTGSTGL